jgi:hypothetical protein
MMTISQAGGHVSQKCIISKSAARVSPDTLFISQSSDKVSGNRDAARNLYFEEVCPVLFTLKLLGMFPYCVTSSGKLKYTSQIDAI